ncbi:nitroreductase family protein [Motiliproteus sp. MSK22-1]|uniref:nitroreductase family protein n=1 Tax=Motiliproteus sp. MSK22-1 TaxID=1897630 RepID=UPI000975455D|nr:nitroreductase family protein [Motiliproteus sp. MSK22-1]OMH38170.1 nitroreductase [Motiliproteus sp. MSK22-1]
MEALELLLNRVSTPVLADPAPNDQQLDVIYRAALRAPDHGALRPWRFLTVKGAAREQLGQVFQQAGIKDNPDLEEAKFNKLGKMAMRAPLVVVVIARLSEHPKVPALEQQVSAGAAAQNMILAAFAQGIGAMWRTGDMAYHPHVHNRLGLSDNEQIIGYLYLGAMPERLKKVPDLDPADFVSDWSLVE